MATDGTLQLKIRGKTYELDADFTTWTTGEAREFKRITGMGPMQAYDELDALDPDLLRGMVWLVLHREDPRVTADSLDELSFGDLMRAVQESEKQPEEQVPLPPAAGGAHELPNGSAQNDDEHSTLATSQSASGPPPSAASTA